MLRNLTIGKRLGYSSSILVALLIVVGLAGYVGSRSVSVAAFRAVNDYGRRASIAADINVATLELRRAEKDTFLNVDDAAVRDGYVAKWNASQQQLVKFIDSIQPLATSDAERQRIEKMSSDFRSYEAGFRSVLAGIQRGELKTPQQCNAKIAESKQYIHDLEDVAAKLNDDYETQQAQQIPVIQSVIDTTVIAILLIVTLALGIAIPATVVLTRSITRPISHVVNAAQEISRGNVNVVLHAEQRRDEIGELNRSFLEMVTYFKDMAAISSTIARGDLAVQVPQRSEHDALSLAFQQMTVGLRTMIKGVRDAASQVASGSGQVAQASDETAKIGVQASTSIDEVTSTMHEMSTNSQSMLKSTKAQADSVRETSASVEQMVVSIRRVDDHVKTLLAVSDKSRKQVQEGISTVEKANQGLDRINQSMSASAENIRALDERAENIGKIIEVIDDISEQTNLLALNAAIEAARAGEHGLGFSVVADEVRKLAEKSAQSTREISDLIQTIQKEARNAVHSMQQNAGIVTQGIELGSELTRSLSQIAQVVSEVDRFATEIGAATSEQSAGSSQIAQATSRLNEITHEISSAAEEQTAGTQTVVKAMERMRDVVNKSSSGASELAAAAEQMARMSRQTLKVTEQFRLLETDQHSRSRETATKFDQAGPRRFDHELETQFA